ncbi:MAG: cytochrome P450 [Polyangiaceae bacterium]
MKTVRDIPLLRKQARESHASEFRRTRGELFVRLHRELGDIGRIRFFNIDCTSVASPELIHEVLVDNAKSFDKSLALKMAFYPLAGKGLFTSEGDLWKRQRKLLSPLFFPATVRSYAPLMNDVIARCLDTWRDGDVIDAGREMTRITMAVVGKVLFDSDTFDDADDLGAAIGEMFNYLTDMGASFSLVARATLGVQLLELGQLPPWADALRVRAIDKLAEPIPWPTPKRRALFRAIHTLNRRVQEMIDERRRAPAARTDLLTRLLEARHEDDGTVMTDRQIRDEAMTLFVAGHETTATSTTWSLYFLARHPDAYRKWHQEISALPDAPPTADEAAQLTYTTGVFKEAMRIYPPAFLLDRVCLEDIRIGGHDFPRFTTFFISPYALHRRPHLFPDPERFDPDRFTPEAEAARPRFSWIPFGAGPRVCIGAGFATLEAQLILAQIAQRFDFEPIDRAPIGPSFLTALRPARPIRLRVRRRTRAPASAA